MIAYICKYTPIEVIKSFGEEAYKIEPTVLNFDKAHSITHDNLCSYSKSVIEEVINKKIDKILFVNCCDSIKRVYDVLRFRKEIKFIHLLDLPRKVNPSSIKYYENEINKFIKAYEDFSGTLFNEVKFNYLFMKKLKNNTMSNSEINIAILGGRCPKFLMDSIKASGPNIFANFTCTGDNNRILHKLNSYSESILSIYPCMHMIDTDYRNKCLKKIENNIQGIIYHTIKFCDIYSFEYAQLKNSKLPILKIETNYTNESNGQMKTRIEAFIESLKKTRSPCKKENIKRLQYILGIDSGSTSTNAVIIDSDKNIVAYIIIRTGAKTINSANKALEQILIKSNLKREDISFIVSTGYGRVSIPFANINVTEITCHGKGAHHINSHIRTIVDIGGQDSKIIRLNEIGEVVDFTMNDKCAAGTGRFLEMMSRTLEIPLEKMGEESLKWKEDLSITNMCSVFAESEVISLIAQNKEISDIIHGINKSISGKIVSLMGKLGKKPDYMLTGGVAKNIGVVKTLEDTLKEPLQIYEEPEIVGALGAAIIGLDYLNGKEK
ncbi:acyl-CoA dehydratase activase [Clostridium lundense]|uniref:acyl-CoA dehydratase activase n=1 Tax=Clostridium lundense TaxID=319475 RepID=UPI00047FBAF5|nr:acyl-CoA dehydratase activase [Clostridium lundense]